MREGVRRRELGRPQRAVHACLPPPRARWSCRRARRRRRRGSSQRRRVRRRARTPFLPQTPKLFGLATDSPENGPRVSIFPRVIRAAASRANKRLVKAAGSKKRSRRRASAFAAAAAAAAAARLGGSAAAAASTSPPYLSPPLPLSPLPHNTLSQTKQQRLRSSRPHHPRHTLTQRKKTEEASSESLFGKTLSLDLPVKRTRARPSDRPRARRTCRALINDSLRSYGEFQGGRAGESAARWGGAKKALPRRVQTGPAQPSLPPPASPPHAHPPPPPNPRSLRPTGRFSLRPL